MRTAACLALLATLLTGTAARAVDFPIAEIVNMAEGEYRVLSSRATLRMAPIKIEHWVRVREQAGKLGVCVAYLYDGPEHMFHEFVVRHGQSTVLLIAPDDKSPEVELDMDRVPGYIRPADGKVTMEQLRGTGMPCFHTDLPWRKGYGGAKPGLRIGARIVR